jgi:caa(3)-type oxidase subunit IV
LEGGRGPEGPLFHGTSSRRESSATLHEGEDNSMHDVASDEFTGHDSKAQYFWVWGALLVLTAIEVVLGYKQVFEPVHMLEILLVLSIIKSALIIGYFMHLKFEKAIMRWMLVISVTACFVIMYFFFFPDAGRILRLGVK